jgi:hypothetical protein
MAWLLLAAVLIVCITPAVDLPETTLGAQQMADLLFWLISAAIFILAATTKFSAQRRAIQLATLQRDISSIPADCDRTCLLCALLI